MLSLPPKTSCDQAEEELMYVINGNAFPAPAAIKERSGSARVGLYYGCSFWVDVSPASDSWADLTGFKVCVVSYTHLCRKLILHR